MLCAASRSFILIGRKPAKIRFYETNPISRKFLISRLNWPHMAFKGEKCPLGRAQPILRSAHFRTEIADHAPVRSRAGTRRPGGNAVQRQPVHKISLPRLGADLHTVASVKCSPAGGLIVVRRIHVAPVFRRRVGPSGERPSTWAASRLRRKRTAAGNRAAGIVGQGVHAGEPGAPAAQPFSLLRRFQGLTGVLKAVLDPHRQCRVIWEPAPAPFEKMIAHVCLQRQTLGVSAWEQAPRRGSRKSRAGSCAQATRLPHTSPAAGRAGICCRPIPHRAPA